MFKHAALFSLGIASVTACGAAPKEPANPSSPPPPADSAPTQDVGKFDLAPVAEPTHLVLRGEWKNPRQTLKGIAACADVEPAILELGLTSSLMSKLGNGGGDAKSLVALDAPVHFLGRLKPGGSTPTPGYAVSIGLSSLERARGELLAKAELGPGLFRVGTKRRGPVCVLAASSGSTEARLVCGSDEDTLLSLTPYMTRNMPAATQAAGAQANVNLSFAAAEGYYGNSARQMLKLLPELAKSEIALGSPKFDAALSAAAYSLSDELAHLTKDLDRLQVEMDVSAENCLAIRTELSLRGKNSWLSSVWEDSAKRGKNAAELFFQLPTDTAFASYSSSIDPDRLKPILNSLKALALGALEKFKLPAKEQKALSELLSYPLPKDTVLVAASGEARTDVGERLEKLDVEDAMRRFEWGVVAFDNGGKEVRKTLTLLSDLIQSAAVKRLLEKDLAIKGRLPAVKKVVAPKELGKDGLVYQFQIKTDETGTKGAKSTSFYMAYAALGTTGGVVGYGANRDKVLEHISSVLNPPKNAPVPRALSALRAKATTGGGYFRLGGTSSATDDYLTYSTASTSNSSALEILVPKGAVQALRARVISNLR